MEASLEILPDQTKETIVHEEEVHEVTIHEYLYNQFVKLKYPDGFVCLDQEKQIYEKIRPFASLKPDQQELFNVLGSFAKTYYEQPFVAEKNLRDTAEKFA